MTCAPKTSSRGVCTAALAAAADRGPQDFPDLLLTPGVGARTVQALAMVAEVVHGAPCRFSDPARFSLAHGGKDRHPYPVPLKVYDETIRGAEVGGARRRSSGARKNWPRSGGSTSRRGSSKRHASGPSFDGIVAEEFAQLA